MDKGLAQSRQRFLPLICGHKIKGRPQRFKLHSAQIAACRKEVGEQAFRGDEKARGKGSFCKGQPVKQRERRARDTKEHPGAAVLNRPAGDGTGSKAATQQEPPVQIPEADKKGELQPRKSRLRVNTGVRAWMRGGKEENAQAGRAHL